MTLTIDLIDSGALKLLRDMESLNLIRVNSPDPGVQEAPRPYTPTGSLSKRFAGALRLSAKKYVAFQSALIGYALGRAVGRGFSPLVNGGTPKKYGLYITPGSVMVAFRI
jgi:hypothetical protein